MTKIHTVPVKDDDLPLDKVFPIGLRTCNRPAYLDLTLRSLGATQLPEDCPIDILDDCSDDEVSSRYYNTNDVIKLKNPLNFLKESPKKSSDAWNKYVGEIPTISSIKGIKGRYNVIQPEERKGVLGGIYWCVEEMLNRYPNAEAVIVIEADVVFNELWYKAVSYIYEALKGKKGPNGDDIGIVSGYNRKGGLTKDGKIRYTFRNIVRKDGDGWRFGDGIGGPMYLVSRKMCEAGIEDFKLDYNPKKRSGDTAFQATCAKSGYNIATTSPSFIQHVGVDSSAWPEKNWRYARSFRTPYAM